RDTGGADGRAGRRSSKSSSVRQNWAALVDRERAEYRTKLQDELQAAEGEVEKAKAEHRQAVDGQLPETHQQQKQKEIEAAIARRDALRAKIEASGYWEPRTDPERMAAGNVGKL